MTTLLANAGVFNLVGAPSSSDLQMDASAGAFTLVGGVATLSESGSGWDFSDSAMTFDNAGYLFDGTLPEGITLAVAAGIFNVTGQAVTFSETSSSTLTAQTGVFVLNGQAVTFGHSPQIWVRAVSCGTYLGEYYEPGDVFLIAQLSDYSDSTQNIQTEGNEWAPGWMLLVPSTTPLYQAVAQQFYPTFPVIDPARRFVL